MAIILIHFMCVHPHTSLEEFFSNIWEAGSWAIVLILTRKNLTHNPHIVHLSVDTNMKARSYS